MRLSFCIFHTFLLLSCLGQRTSVLPITPIIENRNGISLIPGDDNYIKISVPNYADSDFQVNATNSIIIKKDSSYIIRPLKCGRVNIKVFSVKEKDTICFRNYTCWAHLPSIPNAYFLGIGPYSHCSLKKETAANGVILFLNLDGFDYDFPYDITQFDFVIKHDMCETIRITANHNAITEEMKDAILKANTGDILLFDNIRARYRNIDTIVNIYDLQITLK